MRFGTLKAKVLTTISSSGFRFRGSYRYTASSYGNAVYRKPLTILAAKPYNLKRFIINYN